MHTQSIIISLVYLLLMVNESLLCISQIQQLTASKCESYWRIVGFNPSISENWIFSTFCAKVILMFVIQSLTIYKSSLVLYVKSHFT